MFPETVSEAFLLLVLSRCRLLKVRSVHTNMPPGPGVALGVDSDGSRQLTDDQIVLSDCCGSD